MPKLYFLLFLGMSVSFDLLAQTKEFPDSLKSVVIKIEPLSFIYDHVTVGVELPLGNNFLDLNIGVSDVGITNNLYGLGGIVAKVGYKIPFKFNSPFNVFYFMPSVATSHYKLDNTYYYYQPNNTESVKVNATAILLGLGFRHLSPGSGFYYSAGFDFGYGWAKPAVTNNQYNFIILGDDYYSFNSADQTFKGMAIAIHAAVGIRIKKKK